MSRITTYSNPLGDLHPAPDQLQIPPSAAPTPHSRSTTSPVSTPPRIEIPNNGGRVPGKPRDLGDIAPRGAVGGSAVFLIPGQLADVALQQNSMPAEPNGRCSTRRTAKSHGLSL